MKPTCSSLTKKKSHKMWPTTTSQSFIKSTQLSALWSEYPLIWQNMSFVAFISCILFTGWMLNIKMVYGELSSRVPGLFLCSEEVPSDAYSSASEADTLLILNELDSFCNGTEDPQVPAPLISTQKQSLSFNVFSWIYCICTRSLMITGLFELVLLLLVLILVVLLIV